MVVKELFSDTLDTPSSWETFATMFFDDKNEFDNLDDFGKYCTTLRDEVDGCLFVEPWKQDTFESRVSTVDEFWKYSSDIQKYMEDKLMLKPSDIVEVICYWREWNNSFFVIRTKEDLFYGINVGTTA